MGIHPRNKRDLTLPFREAVKQGEEALKRFVAQHTRALAGRQKRHGSYDGLKRLLLQRDGPGQSP